MTTPRDLRNQMGGKVVIPCQAVGDPEPVISWMFNEQELSWDGDDDSRLYTQLPSGALRIESFSAERMGDYRCKATNMMGEAFSRPARMSVQETSSLRLDEDNQSPATTTTSTTKSPNAPGQQNLNHVPEDVTIPLNDSIILDCPERGTLLDRWINPIM